MMDIYEVHIGPLVPHANCHPPIFPRTSRIDGIVRQSCEFLNVQSSKELVRDVWHLQRWSIISYALYQ